MGYNDNHSIHPPTCLITDRLFAGLLPPKEFTSLLLPKVVNKKAITKWELDLDCEIETFLWETINKKTKYIFYPLLHDFHIQFINRGFQYNYKIALYKPNRDPFCTFCQGSEETYVHLFWECSAVFPNWVVIQDLCYENIDNEEFSMFKCLLSNFKNNLITLITIIVKHYIHVSRWTEQIPTVYGAVKAIVKIRNIHRKKCLSKNRMKYYNNFWDLLADDCIIEELFNSWGCANSE